MKMNRFREVLHPALFDGLDKSAEEVVNSGTLEKTEESEKKELQEELKQQTDQLKSEVTGNRRNNESVATSVEKRDEEFTDKELSKQLKQLAKNKKIDFPWTDNEWKCSRAEKKLATASAKVFQQLLDTGNLQTMIDKCKAQNGDISLQDAEQWKAALGINSKAKDIQSFVKAYQEYQNPQSQYQHLKNLMGFFCESKIEDRDDLVESLNNRSKKITKQEIKKAGKMLYQERDGIIIDNKTGQQISRKPKDWEKQASFEVIKNRLKDNNMERSEKMLTLLGDFNLDGEVNSGDVGYKTGSQFIDVFRRTVATKALENKDFTNDTAVKNLVDYANKFGIDLPEISTVDELYQWMTKWPEGYNNTKKLQDFIKNLPIELSDVLSNGANAGAESMDKMVSVMQIESAEREAALKAAEEKTQEIIKNGESRLQEVFTDTKERANITQQLITQLPTMLVGEAVEHRRGLAAGAAVPLDQIIKGLSAGFNTGIGPDGKPNFGLFIGMNKEFDLSDSTSLSLAASGSTKLTFIPCWAASMEIGQDLNEEARNRTLDAKGLAKITLGANVSITGGIFSYGFSAGYENNKQAGIEKQAENYNKVVKAQSKEWIKNLRDAEDKESVLKDALKKEFPDASEEELNKATRNILQIIQGFKFDDQTTENDLDTYAQIIGDVYAEQWKSDKLIGIADKKRKISGGKVGIQFIAGCVPAVTLVGKFTRYRNARTNETEHSRVARLDAQVNGAGNKPVKLEGKEIGESQIAQINEILKRYGVERGLSYFAGEDGKPGRIEVSPSTLNKGGVNVRISETLKGYVKKYDKLYLNGEKETCYSFPANATYRLLQETGGNQRSLTLNIGSDKSSTTDVMLSDTNGMDGMLGENELVTKVVDYKENFEDKGQIEYNIDSINSLFTAEVVEGLKTIDSSDRGKFSAFMKTKRDAVENFDEIVNALKDVLGEDQKYSVIVEKLNNPETSQEDKQLIIDRIMAISAYANVHNKAGLDSNVRVRGEKYKDREMIGPNGQPIFDSLSVSREDIINKLDNYEPKLKSNILGATAFYNKNNTAKGLALTGLGATNVLGGEVHKLEGEDEAKARDWFLGNGEGESYIPGVLDKSPVEWNNIKRAIKDKIGLSGELSDGDLKNILKGQEVELNLDNSDKKVIVKMPVNYVFYLMGECANESVGIELGNLSIKEQEETTDYLQGQLLLNNGDGSNTVSVDRDDFAIGVTVGGWKKKEKPTETETQTKSQTETETPTDGPTTEPTETEEPIGPTTEPTETEEPTTELPPDPTTELPPEPTTELPPEPTTELPPDPTTELPPEVTSPGTSTPGASDGGEVSGGTETPPTTTETGSTGSETQGRDPVDNTPVDNTPVDNTPVDDSIGGTGQSEEGEESGRD